MTSDEAGATGRKALKTGRRTGNKASRRRGTARDMMRKSSENQEKIEGKKKKKTDRESVKTEPAGDILGRMSKCRRSFLGL